MELTRPDAVISSSGDTTTIATEPWQLLNPCPGCGSTPHDAPEGTHLDGSPRWVFDHCFKCGFRPQQVNTNADIATLQRQFDLFRDFMATKTQELMQADPTNSLVAPQSEAEAQKLRDALAAYEAQNAPDQPVSNS